MGSVPAKRGCHLWVKNTWLLLWLAVERPQLVLGEPFSLSFFVFCFDMKDCTYTWSKCVSECS